jgi:hypothetical protein
MLNSFLNSQNKKAHRQWYAYLAYLLYEFGKRGREDIPAAATLRSEPLHASRVLFKIIPITRHHFAYIFDFPFYQSI